MKLLAGTQGTRVDRLVRLVVWLLLVVLLPGLVLALGRALAAVPTRPWWPWCWPSLLLGVALGSVLLRRLPSWCVFEHEFTHVLAGLCFLCLPTRFVVSSRRGGLASHRPTPWPWIGPLVEDFITLAPYVAPTLSVAALLLGRLLAAPQHVLAAAVALTLGYHLATTGDELWRNWTWRRLARADGGGEIRSDIAQVGFGFSLVYIPAMAAALHGLVLAILLNGGAGAMAWAHQVLGGSRALWLGWLR